MTYRRTVLLLPFAAAACGRSPTRTTLTLVASEGLNPNEEQQPSPLVVQVYELRSLDTFLQLQFFDLLDHGVARLGGDLLYRREVEIQPGRTVVWEREADPAARFIGAIAGYRDQANIEWRGAVPLRIESRNNIRIRLDARSMTVETVQPRRFLGIF